MKLIRIAFLLFAGVCFAAPEDRLFVVMGGYNSCGSSFPASMGMYEPFTEMIRDFKGTNPTLNVHYLISCYNSEAPPQGSARYLTSENPSKVLAGNAARLQKEIEKMVFEKAISTVFIVGHSYGGWTGMYLAERLNLGNKLAGLFTVDPIAPSCGPLEVAFGSANCKRAPTDRNIALIQSHTDVWVNQFQNQDGWLHSGPIAGVENHLIPYSRGPHTDIDGDDRTWNRIAAGIY